MALFLSGGEAIEQYTILTPTTTGPIDMLQPDHEEGPQWSSSPTGGAKPKVWSSATQPQSRPEGPDLVSHPHMWIHVEMLKIPHIPWGKSLMPSGKRTMFSCILHKSLSELKSLHLAHWQAAVLWLPQAQQEAGGWWVPPITIPRLHLKHYMPSPTSSDFWIMRQQKTMALTRALQACTEESGFPTGVLCDVAWELQQCMAPLVVLNGDEIVEASLLRPIEAEHRTFPTPEEEATVLGDIKHEMKCKIGLHPVPEQLEICEQVQPAEQIAAPTASLPSPPSQPSHLPSQKVKKPWERATRQMQSVPPSGSGLT